MADFILPEDLRKEALFCQKIGRHVKHRFCMKSCANSSFACWSLSLRKSFISDIQVENEKNAIWNSECPYCGCKDIARMPYSGCMCSGCGDTFTIDEKDRKRILGDEYLKFNEPAFKAMVKLIKNNIR